MPKQDQPGKLWDGRFSEPMDAFVARFTASVAFDKRLAHHDIRGSIAHATMLQRCGILTSEDLDQIVAGLTRIDEQIAAGDFVWSIDHEDVHMNIEARLIADIGEAGKKMHTARSRNDQIATDVRLYLRDEIDELCRLITAAQYQLVALAEREAESIMPGFTHMQIAQPVTFGHHMMAWFEMLDRDHERLCDCRTRVNCMPLGSAALAGTDFPIDRSITAELLGFERISANSLDAVSDRDFAIEFASAASLIMAHLSRWSEELILWMSLPFGFVDLPDRFCTGSSIMPQKKNPDVPELIRGKSARVFGHLMGLLTLVKGQPLTYNRDNQEDKEPLFDAVDTVKDCLRAYVEMLPHIEVKRARMIEVARGGFATATDLADYLAKKGLPFRDAHEVVGKLVALAIGKGGGLEDLSLEEMREHSGKIEDDVFASLTLEGSVASRAHTGGTAPVQVRAAAARARKALAARAVSAPDSI